MGLLDDLADVLSSGTTVCASILKGYLQDRPDTTVCLHEVGGRPADHAMSASAGAAVASHPRVQIVCRDVDYASARAIAQRCYAKLDGLQEKTKNGTLYLYLTAVQPPFFLRMDENDRAVVAFNVDCAVAGLGTT